MNNLHDILLIQMGNFIDHIQKSIYSPEYYRALLGRPASYSWKYYWSFTMFLSVIMTIIISLPMVPQIDRVFANMDTKVLAYYPDDLVLTVTQGALSINKPEPFALPLPAALLSSGDTKGIVSFLVIDTTQDADMTTFQNYHTLLLLNKHALVSLDKAGRLNVVSFEPEMDFTVNEGSVRTLLAQLAPLEKFIAPFIVLMVFFAFLISFAVLLVYLLLHAIFIWLLGKVLAYNWSYATSYRIGLHAVTLPLLFSSIAAVLPIGGFSLPFMNAFLTMLIVYMNYKDKVVPNEAPRKGETPQHTDTRE